MMVSKLPEQRLMRHQVPFRRDNMAVKFLCQHCGSSFDTPFGQGHLYSFLSSLQLPFLFRFCIFREILFYIFSRELVRVPLFKQAETITYLRSFTPQRSIRPKWLLQEAHRSSAKHQVSLLHAISAKAINLYSVMVQSASYDDSDDGFPAASIVNATDCTKLRGADGWPACAGAHRRG